MRPLWACALLVEKHHGERGPDYIAEQVTRLAQVGDLDRAALWRAIADRYDALTAALPDGAEPARN